MRQTIKKTVALLLSLIMLFSVSVISIGATESSEMQSAPLCTVNFKDTENFTHTKTATDGCTVDVNDDGTKFTCNIAKKGTDTGFVTEIKAFKLSSSDVYTIDFVEGETTGGASGQAGYLYVGDTTNHPLTKYGFLTTVSGSTDFMKNTATGKTFTYSSNNFTPYKEDAEDGLTYLYYRLVLDVKNETTKMYVRSINGEYVHANGTDATDLEFKGEYLKLTMISRSKAGQQRAWKNINIYEGDLQKITNVSVTVDGTTETKSLTGAEYTLPSVNKSGYIFAGWKVNGAAKATPAGTVIPTEGLTTLEAVFEEVMSEVWVQFGNTTATTADMRIVGMLDTLNYKSIGYKVSIKKAGVEIYSNETFELTTVYTSLTAKYGTETVTLESLGYGSAEGYLTALTIQNIPTTNANITVELTPYRIDTEDNRVDGTAIVIDFDATWASSSAAQ